MPWSEIIIHKLLEDDEKADRILGRLEEELENGGSEPTDQGRRYVLLIEDHAVAVALVTKLLDRIEPNWPEHLSIAQTSQ